MLYKVILSKLLLDLVTYFVNLQMFYLQTPKFLLSNLNIVANNSHIHKLYQAL